MVRRRTYLVWHNHELISTMLPEEGDSTLCEFQPERLARHDTHAAR
jgi:hypothetical protein